MSIRLMPVLGGFLLAVAIGGPAVGQSKQDFLLVNGTGYDISHVYVSPSNEADWGDDIMGRDVVEDGDEVPITFDRGDKACRRDLMVTYADDGAKVVWKGFDLCKVSKITILYNSATDSTTAITE